MKKILIFGASGLVGDALQTAGHARAYEIVAPTHAEVDLLDTAAVDSYVTTCGADVVVNAAALLKIDALEQDPIPGWQVNTVAAGVIARAAAKHPSTTLIYLSTQLVFDGTKDFYTEDDIPSPTTVYGLTKYQGEILTRHFSTLGNIRHYVVRTALVYGEKRKTFVDEVVNILRAGKVFEASTDQYSNPTSATDLAEAMYTNLIDGGNQNPIVHVINSAPEKGVSRYEIAQYIASVVGVPLSQVVEAQGAVFITTRPNVSLVNTKLPQLPEWRSSLQRHILGK